MGNISKNLVFLRKSFKLNQTQVSDLVGKGYTTIGNWEKGIGEPSSSEIFKICQFFDISIEDFISKDLSNVDLNEKKEFPKKSKNVNLNVDLSVDLNHEKAHNLEGFKPTKGIPLIPINAMAGFGNLDFSVSEKDISKHYVVPDFIDVKADFIITAKGSSMLPKYSSGDKLACRIIRDYQFIQWGKVYVLDTDQGALVKRLYQGSSADTITCHSDNDGRYPRFEIPKTSIRSLAIVVGVIRLE